MEKLYRKNELTFALIAIAVYVVLFSAAQSLSPAAALAPGLAEETAEASFGYRAILGALLTAALYGAMRRLGIREKCGLRRWEGAASRYAFFLPLAFVVGMQLWQGARMNFSLAESLARVVGMLFVGFIEEIVFRGFLFNAILKDEKTWVAILIAGVTFGFGHIVNLLSGMNIADNLRQLVYASSIGVMLTVVFYRSKSLWPCIVFHSAFNALSTFGVAGSETYEWAWALVITAVSLAYAAVLWKKREKA